MVFSVSLLILNLLCHVLHCSNKTETHFNGNSPSALRSMPNNLYARSLEQGSNEPVVLTKLGAIQGYKMNIGENRKIHAFTGIPYAEPPLRFQIAERKRPWNGMWKATSNSPFCIQPFVTTKGVVDGQEDCLYLDIYTPRLPDPNNPKAHKKKGLPVIVMLPAGMNMFSGSAGHGPAYLLREDVVFVPINVRLGIFGFLSTGDAVSPGNIALKDQSTAIEWVYENIAAFGGDPEKITVIGISSGGYASHLMLFTNHESKKYVKGIVAMSGTALANHGLDTVGRVRNSSNLVADSLGCPTSDNGRSKAMVDCLRKVDAKLLAHRQILAFLKLPLMASMLGPTLEPNLPNAFISELPEVQYEKGIVPKIPVIFSRTVDEESFILQLMRGPYLPIVTRNWKKWAPQYLQMGLRSNKGKKVSDQERQRSLSDVSRYYFGKGTPPQFSVQNDFNAFVDMISDSFYNAPMWKSVDHHQKVAPVYVFLQKHNTLSLYKAYDLYQRFLSPSKFGSSHVTDVILLVNSTRYFPPLSKKPEFEKASRNLINLIVNFGTYGIPFYRTPAGKLIDVWMPVNHMKKPAVLEVGLVYNITMIPDPLLGTGRLKIWDHVQF